MKDSTRQGRSATDCSHPYPDLRWPTEPTRKRDGSGWLFHCLCSRCGERVFRGAREPGADKYGLKPEVRKEVEEAWAEFAEGEDVRWRRDRAALVQRLTQAYRLHAIRARFAAGSGHGCAPLHADGGAAESAGSSPVSKRTHPPVGFRPKVGWSRWLQDKRLNERRAREYVLVGAWLNDSSSEELSAAVKQRADGQDLPGWTEVLARAQAWRRDAEAQALVEAAGAKAATEERHATGLRQVYEGHVAGGRDDYAEKMKGTLDAAVQKAAALRAVEQDAQRRLDHRPRPVEAGAVTVRLRGDGPEEATGQVAEALRPVLQRHRLAASVTLKAAEAEPEAGGA